MNTATNFPAYFFQRLSSDPRFLAHVLSEDLKMHMLEAEEQAEILQTTLENRLHLGTCFTPDPDADDFQSKIEQIAGTLKVDKTALTEMIVGVVRMQRFRQANHGASHEINLMAAREKDEED